MACTPKRVISQLLNFPQQLGVIHVRHPLGPTEAVGEVHTASLGSVTKEGRQRLSALLVGVLPGEE